MFNDDIQGTAATVLAGLYGAMKVRGLAPEDLKKQVRQNKQESFDRADIFHYQRILVAGAGSAGSGVILTIRNAIHRRLAMGL